MLGAGNVGELVISGSWLCWKLVMLEAGNVGELVVLGSW